jgi:hypothetical protein
VRLAVERVLSRSAQIGDNKMSTFLFLIAVACAGLIIIWYVRDEAAKGGKGESGLLGMQSRLDDAGKPSTGQSWKSSRGNKPWRVRPR